MAYDKVVDSAALDAALTDIADAIRAKTGKTDPLTLEQMPSEIEGIESGNPFAGLEMARSFTYSGGAPDGKFIANFARAISLQNAFYLAKPQELIDITVTSALTDMRQFARGGRYPRKIIIRGDMSSVTNLSLAFNQTGNPGGFLTELVGLDFTSVTSVTNWVGNQGVLTTLEIKPNTVNISLPIPQSPLSTTSCVNVLNALKDRTGQDALTLTLKSTLTNAESGTINVNYVKLDADTGLYVSCEQTDERAMTIADAITAKNWTIA